MNPARTGPYAIPYEHWPTYTISIYVRGDNGWDWDWRFVGTHRSPERPSMALAEWLVEHEEDALPGRYRALRDDGRCDTANYDGPARALAAH